MDEKYQEAVSGIALARETVRQVTQAIRDGMDAGDDPVVILHNMAGSLSKEAPFQTGGHGAAVFVTACFLLAESGFFDTTPHDRCICPGDPDGEPSEYLTTCPIHRGSWAETLEIMADRQVTADLGEREDEDDPIDAEDLRGVMEARPAAEPCCVAHVDLECALDAPESCCAECPALGSAEPCCPNHHAQCTAVDICCCGCPEIREELGL